MAVAAQMNLLERVTAICASVMQCLTWRAADGTSRVPTAPFYMGYDDVKSVADFLGELQTYHIVSGASEAFIVDRIVPLVFQASARCWQGSQAPFTTLGGLPVMAPRRVPACRLRDTDP